MTTATDDMTFRLLGPVELRRDRAPLPLGGLRLTALLGALLLRSNRTVDRGWLIDAVWPDAAPPSAAANLRQYVTKLRRLARQHHLTDIVRLHWAWPGYRLEIPATELDLTMFQRLADRGRAVLTAGDAAAARGYLTRALGLWRGELCEGLPLSTQLDLERSYWAEARADAGEALVAAHLALRAYREAAVQARLLIAAHPLREQLRAMLMFALYRMQNRGEALAGYADARDTLVAELGIEPGPQLRRLHQAVLTDDPVLLRGASEWLAGAEPLAWPVPPRTWSRPAPAGRAAHG